MVTVTGVWAEIIGDGDGDGDTAGRIAGDGETAGRATVGEATGDAARVGEATGEAAPGAGEADFVTGEAPAPVVATPAGAVVFAPAVGWGACCWP